MTKTKREKEEGARESELEEREGRRGGGGEGEEEGQLTARPSDVHSVCSPFQRERRDEGEPVEGMRGEKEGKGEKRGKGAGRWMGERSETKLMHELELKEEREEAKRGT